MLYGRSLYRPSYKFPFPLRRQATYWLQVVCFEENSSTDSFPNTKVIEQASGVFFPFDSLRSLLPLPRSRWWLDQQRRIEQAFEAMLQRQSSRSRQRRSPRARCRRHRQRCGLSRASRSRVQAVVGRRSMPTGFLIIMPQPLPKPPKSRTNQWRLLQKGPPLRHVPSRWLQSRKRLPVPARPVVILARPGLPSKRG